ncbi:MAG: Ger(x)C family spore germination protein [Eubacteriales bacterium]
METMIKKKICIVLYILIIFVLSGCWSRKEPKSLAIVNSAIFDIKANGQYRVTTEIMNPSAAGGTQESGASEKSPNFTAFGKGNSVREAISNLSLSIEKNNFGGHNKVRFFTERFIQKDMTSALDFLLRDHLADETPLMVVIRGEVPEEIHFSEIGLSEMVGDYVESLSQFQPNHTANSVFVTTLDFIKDYYNDGKQPVVGVAELMECDTKPSENTPIDSGSSEMSKIVLYEGLAAFKDDQLVGYMNGVETRAYNLVTDYTGVAYVSISLGENLIVLAITKSKSDIKTTVEDDQIIVNVNMKMVMSVVQDSGEVDVSKIESLKMVEQSFNLHMQEEIGAAIRKAQQEFESDIFGFGKYVHSQHPVEWKGIKADWDDYFSKARVYITVESSVNRSGEIKEPFIMEDDDR